MGSVITGGMVRRLRKNQKLSIRDLATLLGVKPGVIGERERKDAVVEGDLRGRIVEWAACAAFAGVSGNDVFELSTQPKPDKENNLKITPVKEIASLLSVSEIRYEGVPVLPWDNFLSHVSRPSAHCFYMLEMLRRERVLLEGYDYFRDSFDNLNLTHKAVNCIIRAVNFQEGYPLIEWPETWDLAEAFYAKRMYYKEFDPVHIERKIREDLIDKFPLLSNFKGMLAFVHEWELPDMLTSPV